MIEKKEDIYWVGWGSVGKGHQGTFWSQHYVLYLDGGVNAHLETLSEFVHDTFEIHAFRPK